jgi:hypothetical protein
MIPDCTEEGIKFSLNKSKFSGNIIDPFQPKPPAAESIRWLIRLGKTYKNLRLARFEDASDGG